MKSRKVSKNVSGSLASDSPATHPTVLDFTPERIIAGIRFHLIDEGIVQTIVEDSVRRATNRLERQNLTLSMSQEHWETMDNRERLHWLLTESHTILSTTPAGAGSLHRAEK